MPYQCDNCLQRVESSDLEPRLQTGIELQSGELLSASLHPYSGSESQSHSLLSVLGLGNGSLSGVQ